MATVEQLYYCGKCEKEGYITIADTGTGFINCGLCDTLLYPLPAGVDKFGRKPTKEG